jgi:hypothetical protein
MRVCLFVTRNFLKKTILKSAMIKQGIFKVGVKIHFLVQFIEGFVLALK